MSALMALLHPWMEKMKLDLEIKLNVFLSTHVSVQQRSLVFTNHAELWSTASINPVIIDNEPLTPIPFHYNPRSADITQEVIVHMRAFEQEHQLRDFTVLAFEIGTDRPELLPHSVELHIVFAPLPVQDPCRMYINYPSYLPTQPNRSGLQTTRVRVRQYTFGSDSDTVSEDRIAIVYGGSPSTSAPISRPPRPLTVISRSSDEALLNDELTLQRRLILTGANIGQELIDYLEERLNQFLAQSSSGKRTSIIFTHEPDWWITDLTPTVVVNGPPPPIPDDYDHEHFNIEEDTVRHACAMAKAREFDELFVSSIRLGPEDNRQMHLLFSDRDESIVWYYDNRDQLPLGAETEPYVRVRRVDCEYRQYKENTSDRSYLKKNFSMLRKLTNLKGNTSAVDDFSEGGYTRQDSLRPIAIRLGTVLRNHLDTMLTTHLERTAKKWGSTVIFTNDESLWDRARGPVIVLGEIPPMPLSYDHDAFDIVQDVADYIRRMFARDEETHFRLYMSTLTFGEGASSQIHFIWSQLDHSGQIHYIKSDELAEDCLLTESEPRSGRVSQGASTGASQGASTSTSEAATPGTSEAAIPGTSQAAIPGTSQGSSTSTTWTGVTPAKRRRLNEPGPSSASMIIGLEDSDSDSSLEPYEE